MKKVTILKSIVNWLIKKLLYPFNNDLPYFLLLFTINLFVCFCMILIEGTLSFFISTTLFIYAMTYFLVFTANINKRMGYYVLKPLLLMIGITLFFLNMFCLYKYKSRLAMQIIAGTNFNEIREFIAMYFSWTIVICFLLFVLVISITTYIFITKINVKVFKSRWIPMSIVLIISLILVEVTPNSIPQLYKGRLSDVTNYYYTPTYPKIELESDVCPEYIVTIIGESFAPSHSSIYGYEKETNPLLKKKLEDKELVILDKVTSPEVTTTATFVYLLNTYKVGMEQECVWYKCTNLIEVLKVAGYHTSWVSNQEETGMFNNIPSDHSKICDESVFMTEDAEGNKYDEALIKWNSSNPNKHQAVFYHLMGQHFLYNERYPPQYDIFKPTDYQSEKWKGKILAQYDNATLYNDNVVSSIIDKYKDSDAIVFYFSDHGLDIYDTNPSYCGHAINTPESQAVGKRIPFMVYMSPIYQQLRPELAARIKNAINKEFCTDKLIYAVMDAAGLKFADNDDVRKFSLFSDTYR